MSESRTRSGKLPIPGDIPTYPSAGLVPIVSSDELEGSALMGALGDFIPSDARGDLEPPRFPPGTRLADRYEVVDGRLLGSGGMGRVYSAIDTHFERAVAIKEFTAMHSARQAELEARFRNEAKITARLNHPNLLDVYDSGEHDGRLWYAMEVLPRARSLHDLISQAVNTGEYLPVHLVADVLLQVTCALCAMHNVGLWHRDIKPGNILVYPLPGGRTGVKLIDPGIAHDPNLPLTTTGAFFGTMDYAAPECFEIDVSQNPPVLPQVDHRADIFSVGITFYEAFASAHPYPQIRDWTPVTSASNKFDAVREVYRSADTHPSPLLERRGRPGRQLPRETLPEAVEAIIHRCMERRPQDRYQNSGELLADQHNIGAPSPSRLPDIFGRHRPGPELPPRPRARRARRAYIVALIITVLLAGAWQLTRGLVVDRSPSAATATTISPSPQPPRQTTPAPPPTPASKELDAEVRADHQPKPRAKPKRARRHPTRGQSPPAAASPRSQPLPDEPAPLPGYLFGSPTPIGVDENKADDNNE